MAQRLIQDVTQTVTASCDAGNRNSDCRRFLMKGAQCAHRTSTRSWNAAWNSCGTIGVRSNLEKEMELLLVEVEALRTGCSA